MFLTICFAHNEHKSDKLNPLKGPKPIPEHIWIEPELHDVYFLFIYALILLALHNGFRSQVSFNSPFKLLAGEHAVLVWGLRSNLRQT